jgi:acyl carrier protein
LRALDATPSNLRREKLRESIGQAAAIVLGRDASRLIDPHQPLQELGLDSLMAVELRNRLGNLAGRTLPASLLFDFPTIERLADLLAPEFAIGDADREPALRAEVPQADSADDEAEILQLNQEELVSYIDEELRRLEEEPGRDDGSH